MAITNAECRMYVDLCEKFVTGNKTIFAENPCDKLYVVYSYGYHFPMYVYDREHGKWVGNKDKYSRTTSNHQSKARPSEPIDHWVDTATLKHLIQEGGMTKYCEDRLEGAYI